MFLFLYFLIKIYKYSLKIPFTGNLRNLMFKLYKHCLLRYCGILLFQVIIYLINVIINLLILKNGLDSGDPNDKN